MRSAEQALQRTAIHEAGHAVLHVALGIGCNEVTIVPNHDEGTGGSSTHGGEYGKPGQSLGEPDDDVANLRTYAEDAFLLRHAIANFAGAEAVRRAYPRTKDWKAGADRDYLEAAGRIDEITSDEICYWPTPNGAARCSSSTTGRRFKPWQRRC